jgi:integrase
MAAGINGGAIFRRVSRLDKIWGDGITPKAIWHVVKATAKRSDIKNLAPHDLRRSARLCHLAGGELEQIQFLLGHASVQTTLRLTIGRDLFARPCVRNRSPPGHVVHPLADTVRCA